MAGQKKRGDEEGVREEGRDGRREGMPCLFLILENKMNLDWTNLVSVDSIQPGHSQSNVGLGVQ